MAYIYVSIIFLLLLKIGFENCAILELIFLTDPWILVVTSRLYVKSAKLLCLAVVLPVMIRYDANVDDNENAYVSYP